MQFWFREYYEYLPSQHLLVQSNNGNTRTVREIYPKLMIKTTECRQVPCH